MTDADVALDAFRLQDTRDWCTVHAAGEALRYPVLPVDVVQEHMAWYAEDVSEVHAYEEDGVVWTRTVSAEGRVEERDATLTYTVMNRMQEGEDVLTLEAEVPRESMPDEPGSYLATIWEDRYGTLVADMERLYRAAAFGAGLAREADDPAARVARSRARAADWYGDMASDRLALPLAHLLEEGHGDRVSRPAPYGSDREEKGGVMVELYYDVMADMVAAAER